MKDTGDLCETADRTLKTGYHTCNRRMRGKKLTFRVASFWQEAQRIEIAAINIFSNTNMITNQGSDLALRSDSTVEDARTSPFVTAFDRSAMPRQAADADQCLSYLIDGGNDVNQNKTFPTIVFDLGSIQRLEAVQLISRAEHVMGCGAIFNSYLNGVQVEVSPTFDDKNFRRCALPEAPVFEAVGNVDT